eukprot:11398659-Karenia_brevis.AAC.1
MPAFANRDNQGMDQAHPISPARSASLAGGGLAHDTPSKECLLVQLPGASCSSAQSKAGARERERGPIGR